MTIYLSGKAHVRHHQQTQSFMTVWYIFSIWFTFHCLFSITFMYVLKVS